MSRDTTDYWSRRSFLHSWWRINTRDRRWVPPSYPLLVDAIAHARALHIRRFESAPIVFEAMPYQSKGAGLAGMALPVAVEDQIVGTLLPLTGHTEPAATYLTLLTCANDEEIAERMLGVAWERAAETGSGRLIGPAELAPAFSHGLLLDHFHEAPPLHTPYNAPYLPEVLQGPMEPALVSRLWLLDVDAPHLSSPPRPPGLNLERFDPSLLAGELLPLLQHTLGPARAEFLAPPDALEVEFALRLWAASAPLLGIQARLDGESAGFILAQPDVAPSMRRLRGGYPYWGRSWLRLRPPRGAAAGRVLLGGVAESHEGRAIGALLLHAVLDEARLRGWRTLAIGPVPQGASAEHLLTKLGAIPRQSYALLVAE